MSHGRRRAQLACRLRAYDTVRMKRHPARYSVGPHRNPSTALLVRAVLCAALAATALGCKGDKPKTEPTAGSAAAAPAPNPEGQLACVEAIERAAKLSPADRLLAVANGCTVICPELPSLITTEPLLHRRFVEACGLFCSTDAALEFDNANDRVRWRTLEKNCPHELSLRAGSERYVNGAWGVLAALQRWQHKREGIEPALAARLDKAIAAIWFPLRLVSQIGTGFVLPESAHPLDTAPTTYVSLTMEQMTIGALPVAQLGGEAITVTSGPTAFPGDLVEPSELAAAIGKLEPPRDSMPPLVMLVAPHKLPATRLGAALAAVAPMQLHLGIEKPYPAVHQMPLTSVPSAPANTFTLGEQAITRGKESFALDALAGDEARLALTATMADGVLTASIGDGATASGVAAILDAAVAIKATRVALVVANPTK